MPNTSDPAQANRRKSPRRRPRSAVRVECRKGSSGFGANVVAAVLDVSDTGVRVVLTQAFDPSTEVEILIAGYGLKEPLKRLGNVRWNVKTESGQFCTGIEFQKRLVYRDWQNLSSPN
jgi:hypothetical protein